MHDSERSANNRNPRPLRLLAVLAHPDDESLGLGGIFARYHAEGIETHLITATRGERGWFGPQEEYPGPDKLGRIRECELLEAAGELGIHEVTLLDYLDGEVMSADRDELTREIARHIRRVRPDVVVTFDQNGVYGHPDHIAVTRAATAALVLAADASGWTADDHPPYTVPKLYYFAWTQDKREAYEQAFGELVMYIEGVERRSVPWPQWAISTRVDTSAHWEQVWAAIRRHRSQLPGYQKLLDLPAEYHQALWGTLTFHRVYSLVPHGEQETDLFEGLRTGEVVPL
jgi:LmbE family N-acetylglucosaminyl deacetylase